MPTIIEINAQLYGAPSGVLVAAFAIALGYLLKTLPFFNNKYIPLFVVVFCTVAFMLIAPAKAADTSARVWLVRNFIIGFIIGFAAWMFHAQLLRRFVDPKLWPDQRDAGPKPTEPTKP
jgi:flagellar biosynthesis protein FliR